jgi:rhodanese-related sulfurtransferase
MSTTLAPQPRPEVSLPSSFVLEHAPGSPDSAARYFSEKLAFECDPSDLNADLERGVTGFVIVDARSPEVYAAGHVPGAINLPHRTITAETLRHFPRNTTFVTYCTGPNCNAGTKAGARIGAAGYRIKEMIGGFEYWKREGHPVEGSGVSTGKSCDC